MFLGIARRLSFRIRPTHYQLFTLAQKRFAKSKALIAKDAEIRLNALQKAEMDKASDELYALLTKIPAKPQQNRSALMKINTDLEQVCTSAKFASHQL